jgi:hypothetical protein
MDIMMYIRLASGLLATTYGYGELMCGSAAQPMPCTYGAVSSNGAKFDPLEITGAVAAPAEIRIPPTGIRVHLRIILQDGQTGPCRRVLITDKMHPRWIGTRGWDLTPGTVAYLGGVPTPQWSAKVELCRVGRWIPDSIYETPVPTGRII